MEYQLSRKALSKREPSYGYGINENTGRGVGEGQPESKPPKCNHKMKTLTYIAWHTWAEEQRKQGFEQRQCL
jgi:hypothetical protein